MHMDKAWSSHVSPSSPLSLESPHVHQSFLKPVLWGFMEAFGQTWMIKSLAIGNWFALLPSWEVIGVGLKVQTSDCKVDSPGNQPSCLRPRSHFINIEKDASNPTPEHIPWSEVAQSCLTLCDPMDCSLPGFSVHGIFQARIPWGCCCC